MSKITRKSTESVISVAVLPGPLAPDYRKKLDTPIMFLNHMLEQIAWRSGLNIEVSVKLDKFDLAHVIAEDTGITFGKAVAEYLSENGGEGFGDGVGIIDEARAFCAVSFEGRAFFALDYGYSHELRESVEGMMCEDLWVFLEGFCQGAAAALHVNVQKGENMHHIFESAFRAVGIALGRALTVNPKRAGLTAGVAGAIKFTAG